MRRAAFNCCGLSTRSPRPAQLVAKSAKSGGALAVRHPEGKFISPYCIRQAQTLNNSLFLPQQTQTPVLMCSTAPGWMRQIHHWAIESALLASSLRQRRRRRVALRQGKNQLTISIPEVKTRRRHNRSWTDTDVDRRRPSNRYHATYAGCPKNLSPCGDGNGDFVPSPAYSLSSTLKLSV